MYGMKFSSDFSYFLHHFGRNFLYIIFNTVNIMTYFNARYSRIRVSILNEENYIYYDPCVIHRLICYGCVQLKNDL